MCTSQPGFREQEEPEWRRKTGEMGRAAGRWRTRLPAEERGNDESPKGAKRKSFKGNKIQTLHRNEPWV